MIVEPKTLQYAYALTPYINETLHLIANFKHLNGTSYVNHG